MIYNYQKIREEAITMIAMLAWFFATIVNVIES